MNDLAVIALTVVAFALISRRIGPTAISAPMIFVAVGLLTGHSVTSIVDLELEVEAIAVIGEVTLAVLLFADASRIRGRELRREYMLPARLLGIGLPLSVLVGMGALYLLIADIAIWEAALIAAILAPTDAALGQEVVSDEAVPPRIRQGLIVESGLNDGLVVPAVALFLALAAGDAESGDAGFWVRFVFEQIGIGLLVGLTLGGIGAIALNYSARHGWLDGIYAQLATFALALAALSSAIALGGNGFIAAFVAGFVFGAVGDTSDHWGEFTEDAGQLAAVVSFFLFGNLLLGPALDNVSWQILVCAVLVLTVGRMLPVFVAMIGAGAAGPTVAFVGWFGPRGLASILFGLILLEEELERAETLFAVVAWTVTLSIVLHGATAAWGARRYGAWWAEMSEDERESMPEGMELS